jgi:hypothetical protein
LTQPWRKAEEPATTTIWKPQYRADGSLGPQFALLMCPADEMFFGGSRGGGKTSAMIGHWIGHANKYSAKARGIFFRRRFKQLEEVQRQCNELFPKLGATYGKAEAVWTFPNGATLRLRHLWDADAASEYQGWSTTWICMEELTNWPNLDAMNRMRGTLRSSDGVKCVMLATGNPGGPGHNVVKARYIDPAPGGYVPITDPESGETRVFIPSRLEDNLALVRNDPNYERRLMALGNAQLVKAWRWGDCNTTFGGAFDDLWQPDKHVLRPFPFPSGFTFRRSFDWGSAAPSSLQMWAISDGTPIREMGGFVFPRGSMIHFAEWYTVAKGANGEVKPNVGVRLTNQALGRGIAERSIGRVWSGCVADPSIFAEPGRESIHADMSKGAREINQSLAFSPANNDRITGWQRMRDMIENAAADVPEKRGMWVFENCIHFLRTVPTLQRDESRLDDIDTDQEDHCGDSARYMAMSGGQRPGVGRVQW